MSSRSNWLESDIFFSFFFGLVLLTLGGCSNSGESPEEDSVCDYTVIVDNKAYMSKSLDDVSILHMELIEDCLKVEILSSGCDGNSWKVNLIDAGRVAESNPEQRDLKISLDSQEDCLAIERKVLLLI